MPGMTPDEIALLITLQFSIAFFGFVITAGIWLRSSEKHVHISSDPNANNGWPDFLDQMPDLPSPIQWWTVRRKASVIEAVLDADRRGVQPLQDFG